MENVGNHAVGLPEVMNEVIMRNVLVGFMEDEFHSNEEEYEIRMKERI